MNGIPSAFLISLVLLASCTVKEDRQECPCDVTVMSDGFCHEGHRGNLILSIFTNQLNLKTLCRRPLALDDFMAGNCTYQVPKGWFDVSVVGGTCTNMAFDRDTLLLIPVGCQCDSVCAFSLDCYAYGDDDDMVVKGPLNKQFCTIMITVKNEDGKNLDTDLKLKGCFDGFNVVSLNPHPGEFSCSVSESASGIYMARVPRQADSSLELEVRISDKFSDVVDIGSIIHESGYSWGTLSLEDVGVSLVYGRFGLSVSVCDWGIKEIEI